MFKNIEKFEAFVNENCKYEVYSLEAYLDDVWSQYSANAAHTYEMSQYETKSGRPELYYFDVEEVQLNDDGDFETTIIF